MRSPFDLLAAMQYDLRGVRWAVGGRSCRTMPVEGVVMTEAEWPLTRAELARRYRVSPSTVTRALARAESRHQQDPAQPAPPQPVNPGEPILRYLPADADRWWPTRRGAGRPTATPDRDL